MKYLLEELVDLKIGRTPPRKEQWWFSNTSGVKWVSIKDMGDSGRFIDNTSEFLVKDSIDKFNIPIVKKGTVILSFKLTVGRVSITQDDMLTNEAIAQLPVKDEKILNPMFLYYYLKSYNFNQLGSTSSIAQAINSKYLKKMEIDIPEISMQNKIVDILSSIDSYIECNQKINNNLEQQVSALYQSWFEDFDPTNGVCPDNWSNQTLSTIADISSGKRPPIKSEVYSQETPISIVGAASVMGFTSEANHTDKILVTGRVGTHGVIQRFNTTCWTSDNTLVITSPFYEFTHQILHRIDYSSMNRGSTQPLITQGDMKKVVVLVPDEETLTKFETLACSLMAKWEANNNENVKLASLRDTLLPKLMSGELDVSDIDL